MDDITELVGFILPSTCTILILSHTVTHTWLVRSRMQLSDNVKWSNRGSAPFFAHITYQFHYKHCLIQEAEGENGLKKNYHGMFYMLYVFTCAAENTSIFTGHTVVNSQPIVPTLCEVYFISSAVNIVQQNKAGTRSKVWQVRSICSWHGSVYVVWNT